MSIVLKWLAKTVPERRELLADPEPAADPAALSPDEEKAFRAYLEEKWAASVTPSSFSPDGKEVDKRWLSMPLGGSADDLPAEPLWKASDPLPSQDELVNTRRSFSDLADQLARPAGFRAPRGPTEARVKAYIPPYTYDQWVALPEAERKAEFKKWENSVLHPQGEVFAAMRNMAYLQAPPFLGGRPWSSRRHVHRVLYNMSRYPAAESWFGDGFRLGRAARAVDVVPTPNSWTWWWNNAAWSRRLGFHVVTGVGAGLTLAFFINTFVSKSAPTATKEWEQATKERYAKYNPNPISAHKIGKPVEVARF